MSPTDIDLIARVIAEDDRHAFSTLVRKHQSQVRNFLRRLTGGDQAQADDLAQETFALAYRGLKNYRAKSKFSSWLISIAYRQHLSAMRRQSKREYTTEIDESSLEDWVDNASKSPEDWHLKWDVESAMMQLREEEYVVISMAYTTEATHEEIAEMLQWPLGTVKSLILRGREKLKMFLESDSTKEPTYELL